VTFVTRHGPCRCCYRQLVENTAVYYGCCSALIHLDDTLILFQVSCIFTTLRYANALFAVVAVCPSLRHKPVLYRNDCTNRAGFGMEASFNLSHTVLLRNWVSPKSLWNFVPNSGKFRHGNGRSRCQQNSSLWSSTVEFVDVTYDSRRLVAFNYYKSVNCIGSNLYYFDSLLNVDLLYNLFLQ